MISINLLQAPQGGGAFQLVLLSILAGVVFLVGRSMKKNEVANSSIENVENLNEQILLVIARYSNGFLIIIISTIIQLINTFYYIRFIDSHLSNFKFDDKMDNYFNEIKSNTLSFAVFTVLSIILYLVGFLKLWRASKIKRK
jgi:hypothetical protein